MRPSPPAYLSRCGRNFPSRDGQRSVIPDTGACDVGHPAHPGHAPKADFAPAKSTCILRLPKVITYKYHPEAIVGSPYGFELVENCLICKLRNDSFFCSLPKTALEAFDKMKYTASYPAGAVLFVEGQSPRGIYMLCKGRVKLSTTSAEGKTLILKIAQPGEVLGMHATVSGTPYEITAETGQPCQLNFVKREDFLNFLQKHGDACLKAAQHLSKDCQSAYQQIRSLGLSHSAPERLARLLLEWTASSPEQAEPKVKLALTHEEIAQIIGTSRETVTRVLADFRKRQIAVLKGSTLTVRNKGILEKLVGA